MELENLKEEDFEIEAVRQGTMVELIWMGSVQVPEPDDLLDPYFEKLLVVAQKNSLSVRCDFTKLDYMNSASIPPLINLLRRLAELEIQGEFIYDASRKVQAASFRALDVIARKSEYTSVRGA